MAEADARELRKCISDAKIVAFVSEATVFIECLSFEDKLTYLAAAFTKNARPEPDPRRVAVFEHMASLGVKMLHAPLILSLIHISEPTRRTPISYAVFCLKK